MPERDISSTETVTIKKSNYDQESVK
jgi:hypothetical protein